MKIEPAFVAALAKSMRRNNILELEIAEGDALIRICMPMQTETSPLLSDNTSPETGHKKSEVLAGAVGRFYTSHPSREGEFASGDTVAQGEIVGLVEVGSILRPVSAPLGGLIMHRLRASGDFVDFGSPILQLHSLSSPVGQVSR